MQGDCLEDAVSVVSQETADKHRCGLFSGFQEGLGNEEGVSLVS